MSSFVNFPACVVALVFPCGERVRVGWSRRWLVSGGVAGVRFTLRFTVRLATVESDSEPDTRGRVSVQVRGISRASARP